jgi:hypothetical protein
MAAQQEIKLQYALELAVPVFNRPFRQIAKDFLADEELRAKSGQITFARVKRLRSVIESKLNAYVGSIQINLIGPDRWENYPNWRRAYGEGRMARPGFTRERTDEEVAQSKARADAADKAREKAKRAKGDARKFPKVNATAKGKDKPWILVSDATISFEMSVFGAVMSYAQRKRYVCVAAILARTCMAFPPAPSRLRRTRGGAAPYPALRLAHPRPGFSCREYAYRQNAYRNFASC